MTTWVWFSLQAQQHLNKKNKKKPDQNSIIYFIQSSK